MVKERVGQGREIVAIIDGCHYMSFRVFECLPPSESSLISTLPFTDQAIDDFLDALQRRPPRDFLRVGPQKRRDLMTIDLSSPYIFDPTSTLVGYISDNCGPRGKVALADLTQCEYGHEKVEFVPWQEDTTVANIGGCSFFSFEVYECLPQFAKIWDPLPDYQLPAQDLRPPSTSVNKKKQDVVSSCAVTMTNGSCHEPGRNGLMLGTTDENELVAGGSFHNGDEFDGKIMLVHDHDGTVIGCGTIEDEIEPADCLCGHCANCDAYMGSVCNALDSCVYNGSHSARPHSLYLKLSVADEYMTQINVYFKGKNKVQESCQTVVNKDINGLFHIAKPSACDDDDDHDDDGSLGAYVYIDFRGDDTPDAVIHTSCSVALYVGMPIEKSPFLVEGYCMSGEVDSCFHLDQNSSQICSAV